MRYKKSHYSKSPYGKLRDKKREQERKTVYATRELKLLSYLMPIRM